MSENHEFFKIRISHFRPGKEITFDLYVLINDHYTLYVRAGDAFKPEKLQSLKARDQGDTFYVKETDRPSYKAFIHSEMVASDLTPKEKAQVLRDSSVSLVEEIFENPDVQKALNDSRPIITEFVDFMDAEPEAMGHLISLSGHDFYTYNHSLDVGIYCLGLGQAMSYDKKTLEELGIGALFHDIGKRQVSLDILCKKGPLSDAEWVQMQKHPQFGLLLLDGNASVSDAIKAACFEHHESWAGNGYPQQIVGQEIHPFARIVAICDTYDAMTTQRSYNVPLKPFDAVTMMKEKLAGRYDPDMLKALHEILFKLKAPAA